MLYQQKGGTCAGFAVANAIEAVTGVIVQDEDIYNFYKKYDLDRYEGMNFKDILAILEDESLAGVKVQEYKELYHVYKKRMFKNWRSEVRLALQQPDTAVLLGLRTRSGLGSTLPLDSNYFLKPRKTKIKGFHAVLLEGLLFGERRKNLGFIVENSWGDKWGDEGYFYMDWDTIDTEAHEIVAVKFTKALAKSARLT